MQDTSPRALGGALAALGALACAAALTIGDGDGAWGERTVPLIAGLTTGLSGLAVAAEPMRADRVASGGEWRAAALIGLGFAWVSSIGLLGFLLPTAVAAPLAFAIFGMRRPDLLAATAVIVPLGLHLFFFQLLGVFPPYGRLFDLADHLPL